MLKKAKHNADNMGLKIDFFHGDAENLPSEDSSLDLVTGKFPALDYSAAFLRC